MKNSKTLISTIELLNKLKQIERLSIVKEKGRRESDAEHSWHLVTTLWLLSEHYEKKIDLGKAIKIGLIHDLPEIISGDVYAHSTEITKEQKKKNEKKAMKKIIGKMPPKFAKEVKQLWEEYEERKTEEAKFVWLTDKLMPRLMHKFTKGDCADNLKKDLKHKKAEDKKIREMSSLFRELLDS
jgi:putative hydrolases of HD superfamily